MTNPYPVPVRRRMTRDATQFTNPDEFIPERFLEGTLNGPSTKRYDPNVFVFGFGRRCVYCRTSVLSYHQTEVSAIGGARGLTSPTRLSGLL